MKIDGFMTNPAPPGQLVITQGDGLDAAHKLLFGGKPVPFKVNSAGNLETEISRGSGAVEVPIELEDGDKSSGLLYGSRGHRALLILSMERAERYAANHLSLLLSWRKDLGIVNWRRRER